MQDNDDFKYVKVIFENKNCNLEEFKFYGKGYLYKTKKDLKENQEIELNTIYGTSNVKVSEINIDKKQASKEANEIGLELEDLKEI